MLREGDFTKVVGHIDIRVFVHATEDHKKVEAAVRNLLPEELAQTIIFETSCLTGHHGNSITVFTARITEKKLLPKALEKIGSQLNSLDKEELCKNLGLHLEKGNLYLRFDKQCAFIETLKFSTNDPIHVKIHFKNKSPEEITELCQTAGLLP